MLSRFSRLQRFGTDARHAIKSNLKPIEIPQTSLPKFIWHGKDKWLDKTAVICSETGRSYSYHELYKRSLSFGGFLKKNLKLSKHDTVGIVLSNVPEYPIVFLGAIQAGFKVTTCNPNYTAEEINKQLKNCNTRVVVAGNDVLSTVQKAACDIPIIEISNNNSFHSGCINFNEISAKEHETPSQDFDINDTIVLPYSSGTTGLPKGVEISHLNIISNISQCLSPEIDFIHQTDQKQDVIPGFLPFFHIYGMVSVMLHSLLQGAKLVTMPKFTSKNYIDMLKIYKPDVLFAPPPIVLLTINNPNIKKEDLICLRLAVSGAAPLAASDVEHFLSKTDNKVHFVQAYGMTETTSAITCQTPALEHGVQVGGSGFLLPNCQARITTLDNQNTQDLGPNQSGELVVKGPNVMKGYYNNPEATKDTFLEGGWLKTGDIAHYDEHGHFFVTDRLKELIKVKGFQVAPAELEGVLRDHPGVEDAAVIGVPHDMFGEAPKAFVVKKSNVNAKDLQEFVANKVSKHKHLSGGVVFIDSIPKTPSGKILRRELRKL